MLIAMVLKPWVEHGMHANAKTAFVSINFVYAIDIDGFVSFAGINTGANATATTIKVQANTWTANYFKFSTGGSTGTSAYIVTYSFGNPG